jgi:transposase
MRTTRSLYELLDWIEQRKVTHIAMESIGIYCKPEGYFDITVANAQRIKNIPGRKTDVSDAECL